MIILDTHAWLWWIDDHPRLGPNARRRIDSDRRHVSAISMWELAMLASKGRLTFKPSVGVWLDKAATRVEVNPLTVDICIDATQLTDFDHGDPADRLIIALARSFDAELVTVDRKILSYASVRTIYAKD